MQSFIDTSGKTWVVDFNTATLKRCVKMLDHNPLDLFDKEMSFATKLGDPIYLVDLLWVVLFPEIQLLKLTEESFYTLFKGDVLLEARHALAVAMANFFQEPQKRKAAQAMISKTMAIEAALLEKLSPLTEQVEALDVNQLASAAYDSLMSGQESSESIPTASP